jgi:transposase
MRYELTDHEWTAIKPMLPNKPRGVPPTERRTFNSNRLASPKHGCPFVMP